MSSNVVKKAISVGSAKLAQTGKEIVCEVALETEVWKRTEAAAEEVGKLFKKALEKTKEEELPVGTAKLVTREGDHRSEADKRNHFTAEARDANDAFISTVHIVVKK
ncbi:hypothetical protein BDZ45DRAFT_671997 [Acephala macrosclerotiorum]|nr:hypothetical protein BDZ45DRAFT_671997 [Acephala macrosclerotiorum]